MLSPKLVLYDLGGSILSADKVTVEGLGVKQKMPASKVDVPSMVS